MAAAVGLLAASPFLRPAHSTADSTCSDFSAVAAAHGVQVAFSSPGYLVVEEADSGLPAAQASVDSRGNSTAFAGYPDPGTTIMTTAATGGAPTSAYPLLVSSTYPSTQEATADRGPVTLKATSAELASSADARGGSSQGGGTALGLTESTASASCGSDGTVKAMSDNDAEALTVSNVLRVGRNHSTASVTVGADGTPKIASHFDVGQITVAGQTAELTERGLEVGGNPVAAPGNPLGDALAGAGISVRYLNGVKSPDGTGVVAPGMEVRFTRQMVGTGPTVVTVTFGRAFASAGAAPGVTDAVAAPGADLGTPSSQPDVAPVLDSAPGPAITSADALTSPAPLPAEQQQAAPSRGTAHQPPVRLAAAINPNSTVHGSPAAIYPALVAAAVALFAGGFLLRVMGVKLGWT